MKFIWHIIRKDVLRDRWALLVWGLLFVAQTGIGRVMLHWNAPDLRDMVSVQFAAEVLVFLQFVMGYILVARLVQADALVGTSMFWLTRPVSVARLLTAKALGAVLLFGLLPVLLLLPWWLSCGFGWREVGWTAIETFGWQLLMIAPAFLVASLTDDLGRLLLWTLLLLIGLMSWVVMVQASLTAFGTKFGSIVTDLVYTRLCLAALTLIAGSAAIAAHQYLTRRFVRSVVLAAAGLGLIALIGQIFPWNWTPFIRGLAEPAMPTAPAELVEGITFEVLPAQDLATPEAKEKGSPMVRDTMLNLRMRVQGLPEGLQVGVEQVAHAWSWANGIRIARRSNSYSGGFDFDFPVLRRQFSLPVPAEDPETAHWTKVKRAEIDARLKAHGLPYQRRRSSAEEYNGKILNGAVSLPKSFVGKMRNEPGAYSASFQGFLYRLDVMAELPLKAGAFAVGDAQTFRLQQVRAGRPRVLTTEPALPRSGLWNSGGFSWQGDGYNWRTMSQAVALNLVTGDISWVGSNQSGSQSLVVAGVVLNWNIMQIGWRTVIRDGKNVGLSAIDSQWPDHTKLVFLTPTKVGSFTREVRAEKYTVTDDFWENVDSDRKTAGKP